MKYIIPSVFFILILFPTLSYGQDSWVKFKADDGMSFSIDAPGEMEKSSKKIKTAVGELTTLTYAYQGTEEDPNYLYLINFVTYPESTFPDDSISLISDYLDNSILSSVENVAGDLIYASDLEKDHGKLFRIKYNDGNAIIKGKSYIINDVFVSLQVFTVQSKSLNDEMDYFLDSFKASF